MAMALRGGGAGASRPGGATVYERFTPAIRWEREEEAEKIIIPLPGVVKDKIKIKQRKNIVTVLVERIDNSMKVMRFEKEFETPKGCDVKQIKARFHNQILTITMPFTKTSQPKPDPQKGDQDGEKREQKTSEAEGKVTGEAQEVKPLTGLAGLVEGEKGSEVIGKDLLPHDLEDRKVTNPEKERVMIGKNEQKELRDEQTPMTVAAAISPSCGDNRLGNYNKVIEGVADLKEKRQLLVNVGVAVLVILALGVHIYCTASAD